MILVPLIIGVLLVASFPLFLNGLSSMNRWWKLAGVLLYWLASWGAAEALLFVGQLNLNWQEGHAAMLKLDSFIAALKSGAPLLDVRYDLLGRPLRFPFIFCVAGVCWNITAALLAVNPYKKYTWIVFLIAPLWFGGSLFWNMRTEWIDNSRRWQNVQFFQLKSEIEEARKKGIPDSAIVGNLEESRKSFQFTYENNRAGRESVRRTLESLRNLPDSSGLRERTRTLNSR